MFFDDDMDCHLGDYNFFTRHFNTLSKKIIGFIGRAILPKIIKQYCIICVKA